MRRDSPRTSYGGNGNEAHHEQRALPRVPAGSMRLAFAALTALFVLVVSGCGSTVVAPAVTVTAPAPVTTEEFVPVGEDDLIREKMAELGCPVVMGDDWKASACEQVLYVETEEGCADAILAGSKEGLMAEANVKTALTYGNQRLAARAAVKLYQQRKLYC
jgi:hypothetical protein